MAIATTGVRFDFLGRDVSAGRTAEQVERRFKGLGGALAGVTAAVAGGAAAAAAGLGVVINKAADYDKTIRKVAVITGESGEAMKGLSDLAMKMGADTVFSAGDAANAMLELAKGGMTAATIQGGALQATMTLAAAGELQMGDAATYVANSLQMFGLRAEDAGKVTTALAGGANASSASVESLGLALSQVGPGAKLAGASIEETVAVLSAFDAAGIKGSDAGTSLKTMLSRLVPSTAKASDAMRELGLKFTDANGKFLPMRDIAEQLQQKLSKLSPEMRSTALNTIFGSDAFRAAAIMAELGAEGVDKYTRATKDSKAATDLANVGMQGASGAIEKFKGNIETLGIKIGTGLLPAFTTVLNGINDKVLPAIDSGINAIGDMFGRVDWKGHFATMKARIEDALPDVDWGKVAADLKATAASWGGDLIEGVRTGFATGNWEPLGRTIGDGIGKALDAGVSGMSSLTKKIGDWFGSIDWFDVGASVGSQAAPFAIGFFAKLGENLISTAREHPMDTAIAITSFLGIGKIAGVIGKILGKIPILRVFAPFFQKWNDLTGPINGAIGGFFRAMGRGFSAAMTKFFPEVGGRIIGRFRGIADEVGLRAMYMADGARRFLGGIPVGIGKGLGTVTGAVLKIIVRMTSPFVDAAVWLINKGKGFVGGLVRGIGSVIRTVGDAAGRVIGRLVSPFKNAGTALIGRGRGFVDGLNAGLRSRFATLSNTIGSAKDRAIRPFVNAGTFLMSHGRRLIGGLLLGIRQMMAGTPAWIRSNVVDPIIRSVKRFFGIRSPSRVMMGIGGHLITGLVKGMAHKNPTSLVSKIFGSMPKALGALVNKGLINLSSLPSKALDALSGLGGKFKGLLDGIGGFLGGGGGNASGLVAFGRWLQAMGYTVSEHPAFGGVTYGAHTNNSQHYRGQAIDVNRGAGTSAREQAYLSQIIGPAHRAGFRTIFMAPGHYNHAHIAMAKGGVIGEHVRGVGLKTGRSYSFGENGPETVLPGTPRYGGGGLTVVVQVNGPIAGSQLAVENMVVAAVDAAKRKGRIRV